MIVFPLMLVAPAKKSGIAVPPEPDDFGKYKKEFPHFFCFCVLQLARPMRKEEQWENAKVIASIPVEELFGMTVEDFVQKGLSV